MATIRYYFQSKPQGTKPAPEKKDGLYYENRPLCTSSDGFYIEYLYQEVDSFKPSKSSLADFFSVCDYHDVIGTKTNTRISGEYSLRSAKGTCDAPKSVGGKTERLHQCITIRGSSWEDVQELVRKIKVGSILPILSYENQQIKPLPAQFYDWLVMGARILKRDILRFRGVY
jgi:hypothetical protein